MTPDSRQGHLAAADLAACRAVLRAGSKSFTTAAALLPERVRRPATVLYAFCRVADDAVDRAPATASTIEALRNRLQRAYMGLPDDHPIDRALAAVAIRERVPRELLEALLEGMAWDAEGRRYETLEELHAYAARVAGTVGAMLSLLMERREPEVVARACDLGIAMQLTNIARDVGEDARMGRLYLPRAWLRERGLDPEAWLARPTNAPAIAGAVARLLEAAEVLYRRADAGVPQLPADCRMAIRAARNIYAEIGREVARSGFDAVTRRAVVSTPRKLWLLARAAAPGVGDAARLRSPPVDAARFLVAACVEAP